MRLIFAGSPEIAIPSLKLLHQNGYIAAVLSSPDAAKGRRREPVPSPVAAVAEELGLPVLKPERLNGEIRKKLAAFKPDLLAVFAYGKIFGPRFLAIFPKGGVNLHPSLLPLHRGPAPLQSTILSGDNEWGITVQKIALEMDAGDILLQQSYPCSGNETAATLSESASHAGADALLTAVRGIESGRFKAVAQDHSQATYCHLLSKEEGEIDWNLSAESIGRHVRAFDPWPGSFTWFGEQKLNIWKAVPLGQDSGKGRPGEIRAVDKKEGILVQTGSGLLALRILQLQGKKRLDWRSFLNGVRGFEGAILGGHR